MIEYIKIKQGLDIPISGKADPYIKKEHVVSGEIAVKPTDFRGITPKLLVSTGDRVKAGSPLFCDKLRPEMLFTSPCSGTVSGIIRGEKRKILEVRVEVDKENDYLSFDIPEFRDLDRKMIIDLLLKSGLWPSIIQRPFGIVANPTDTPRDIFISGFYSAPLAPDPEVILKDELDNLQAGVDILSKLTQGGINISLQAQTHSSSIIHKLKGVKYYVVSGPHPAGNVGIQIQKISPINKGEIVWTLDPQMLSIIGRFFRNKVSDMTKRVAITGPMIKTPSYISTVPGVSMSALSSFIEHVDPNETERIISGNVLSGTNIGREGFLGYYDNQITALKEGTESEMLGWAKPIRPKKFSISKSYFSWLTPKKTYPMDTNLNGGERAFVVNDVYSKVFPMDIYPVYLLKAILADDIDKMEKLGIYEVIEEDMALCEYVCPSKIEIQSIVRRGIDLMLKELA